jgi:hypothetical protein
VDVDGPAPADPLGEQWQQFLVRHGVPEELLPLDAFHQLLTLTAGSGSIEQFWTARRQMITSSAGAGFPVYYEGLLISLVLDMLQRGESDAAVQLLSRRWLTLQLVGIDHFDWQHASALFPMTTRGGLAASYLSGMQRFAKTQRDFAATRPSRQYGTSASRRKGTGSRDTSGDTQVEGLPSTDDSRGRRGRGRGGSSGRGRSTSSAAGNQQSRRSGAGATNQGAASGAEDN